MAKTKTNYAPWNIRILSINDFMSLNTEDQLIYFCKFGVLAPSTHNTQPWKFVVSSTDLKIDIYLDRTKILPASDVVGRQATISIGCCIENIILAANHFQWSAVCNYQPMTNIGPISKKSSKSGILAHMVSVKFTKRDKSFQASSKNLLQAMISRKIERAEYNPAINIPKSLLQHVQNIADGRSVRLHIISDQVRKLTLAEFQAQADSYVINDLNFKRELGDWLLPNDTKSFVGMPGIGFCMEDPEALRIHEGLTGKIPLHPEDGLKFALGAKHGIEKSPIIGVLTVLYDKPEYWIRAGRVFEKIFLLMTSQKFNLAVHAAIAEVPLINNIFSATLGTKRKTVLVFRCGKVLNSAAAKIRPHSPRMPIEKLMINNIS